MCSLVMSQLMETFFFCPLNAVHNLAQIGLTIFDMQTLGILTLMLIFFYFSFLSAKIKLKLIQYHVMRFI